MLCVTHLPQVAVFADAHYVVSKDLSDASAETHVPALDDAERLDELASMLAGDVTESVRQSALELLERAADSSVAGHPEPAKERAQLERVLRVSPGVSSNRSAAGRRP